MVALLPEGKFGSIVPLLAKIANNCVPHPFAAFAKGWESRNFTTLSDRSLSRINVASSETLRVQWLGLVIRSSRVAPRPLLPVSQVSCRRHRTCEALVY